MKDLIVTIFLASLLCHIFNVAEASTSIRCKIGNTGDNIDIEHEGLTSRYEKRVSFKKGYIHIVVADVHDFNESEDYMELSNGTHSITYPLYCRRL